MRITCPYCGERSNDGFTVLGDADALLQRPASEDIGAYDAYLHRRVNPAGLHRELWHHHAGCRHWLVVTRDTRTHIVHGTELTSAATGSKS